MVKSIGYSLFATEMNAIKAMTKMNDECCPWRIFKRLQLLLRLWTVDHRQPICMNGIVQKLIGYKLIVCLWPFHEIQFSFLYISHHNLPLFEANANAYVLIGRHHNSSTFIWLPHCRVYVYQSNKKNVVHFDLI